MKIGNSKLMFDAIVSEQQTPDIADKDLVPHHCGTTTSVRHYPPQPIASRVLGHLAF
jgi:hypothetical protein